MSCSNPSPLLVVAYNDDIRIALSTILTSLNEVATPCASFSEAEHYAYEGLYKGIVVDLATVIKAKDTERLVANILTINYPTLRVRAMGSMIIPMIMSGGATQDKSLNDFLTKTCTLFAPRKLRTNKRKDTAIPVVINAVRGFCSNISWSGMFIVDMNPERHKTGDEIRVGFPMVGHEVDGVVERIQEWGTNRMPGFGIRFKHLSDDFENDLEELLKHGKENSRDRVK